MRKSGMGSHESALMGKDEWLTPLNLIQALGPFDLDPCAAKEMPWPTATIMYSKEDDGLTKPWQGGVFCNPPYGQETGKWLKKCCKHGNAIALVFARTETKMFHEWVWNGAYAIYFFKGRLSFYHVDGTKATMNAGAPSCLIAYNEEMASRLLSVEGVGYKGKLILLPY